MLTVGMWVRCVRTQVTGKVAMIKKAEEVGLKPGMPDMVFIETDAKTKTGVVRDLPSVEPLPRA